MSLFRGRFLPRHMSTRVSPSEEFTARTVHAFSLISFFASPYPCLDNMLACSHRLYQRSKRSRIRRISARQMSNFRRVAGERKSNRGILKSVNLRESDAVVDRSYQSVLTSRKELIFQKSISSETFYLAAKIRALYTRVIFLRV